MAKDQTAACLLMALLLQVSGRWALSAEHVLVSVAWTRTVLLCLSDGWQRLHTGGNEEVRGWSCSAGLFTELLSSATDLQVCLNQTFHSGWLVGYLWLAAELIVINGFVLKTVRTWRLWKSMSCSIYQESRRGGSKVGPVWVSWPLASLGSHKLVCCNSLPDGLAPAGVCLYIRKPTGDVRAVMSMIYGVGNVVWEETCSLNILILPTSTWATGMGEDVET